MNPMVNLRLNQVKQVQVMSVNLADSTAVCRDTEGQYIGVSLAVHRTGVQPQVGQVWLVDRELSLWSLRALVDSDLALAASWQPLALSGAWVASSDPDDPPPTWRVTLDGWVELSGVITSGALSSSVGVFTTVATLPSTSPDTWKNHGVLSSQVDPAQSLGHVRGVLRTDRTVGVTITKTPYTPTWVDLSGLRARVK